MPQLVRDLRYCSHCEAGVEMGESMSLCHGVRLPLGRIRDGNRVLWCLLAGVCLTNGLLQRCDSHHLRRRRGQFSVSCMFTQDD